MSSRRIIIGIALTLAGCRGEPVPRDYQNSPPAVTHPVQSQSDTPSANGMRQGSPEPNSGAEGKVTRDKPVDPLSPTATLKDQASSSSTAGVEAGPPPGNSQHATQTTATAVTGTHLATPP